MLTKFLSRLAFIAVFFAPTNLPIIPEPPSIASVPGGAAIVRVYIPFLSTGG